MPPTISVIIPVYNAAGYLDRCLRSLKRSRLAPLEIIVVDDGSSDGSGEVAADHKASLITNHQQRGPAYARNVGAGAAQGDVLLFLDSDVSVHENTLGQIARAFESAPSLDAVVGSYDDSPDAQNFVSLYKNLLNHYMHQSSRSGTFTFWGACGAIKKEVFFSHGGFDTKYVKPSIEDIELGYRLAAAGRRVILANHVLVKHLKRWGLRSLIETDIWRRAVPWTELILRYRSLPDDLNLRWSQRLSTLLIFITLASLILSAAGPKGPTLLISLGGFLSSILLNCDFYLFLGRLKGVRFALCVMPLHALYFLYSGLAFLIGAVKYALTKPASDGKDLMAHEHKRAEEHGLKR
ncbi:MAG TPA: glycosyltransferase family 2 protein [Blastocatellia bacterium]|jgi:glycosyltransferase involved in cell wall biosynthesis